MEIIKALIILLVLSLVIFTPYIIVRAKEKGWLDEFRGSSLYLAVTALLIFFVFVSMFMIAIALSI
jgi:hypothetical protein